MAFLKYKPYGNKQTYDITTTTSPEVQLWQEFAMLRLISGPIAVYGKKVTAPWIDQAKIYFQDACKSSWKTSGLLYYYSFLNLAKAFIASKRSVSGNRLKSTSIYHGLSADAQSVNRIIDYEVEIHPPTHNGKFNIFALLFERLTTKKWPFRNKIIIQLSEVVPYCQDISHEINLFYGIQRKMIIAQSLIRQVTNNAWFEILVHDTVVNDITQLLTPGIFNVHSFNNFTPQDKSDWLVAYERTNDSLQANSAIRFNMHPFTQANRTVKFQTIMKDADNAMNNHILPMPSTSLYTMYIGILFQN